MIDSLSTLLDEIVDYAGLFPPAKLDMLQAVRAYEAYRREPASVMLGRFIVPVSRLLELDELGANFLPTERDAAPWRLSVIAGDDLAADVRAVEEFNSRHRDHARGAVLIDSVEGKATSAAEVEAARRIVPEYLRLFLEIPTVGDPTALLEVVRASGVMAKIRTGGVTPDAFPPTDEVVRFLTCARAQRTPFKVTAGLHHPIRANYRLTYEHGAPMGTMYGYLNVFIAAALVWIGADDALLRQTLEERDAHAFDFTRTGVTYRGHTVSTEALHDCRTAFALSFGSCSFREPVDDLAALFPAALPPAV